MQKKPAKKTRDVNQLAKGILDAVTGEAPAETKKDPAAVARGRKGGITGGKARAAKLAPAERKAIAEKAAAKRWGKSAS